MIIHQKAYRCVGVKLFIYIYSFHDKVLKNIPIKLSHKNYTHKLGKYLLIFICTSAVIKSNERLQRSDDKKTY